MTKEQLAKKIVKKVLSNLSDRRGFGLDEGEVDDEVYKEMVSDLRNDVAEEVESVCEDAAKYKDLCK